jgi:hypothetical protein
MKTSKMSVCFAIVMLIMMVVPAHAKKLCFQLNPDALGAGASLYMLTEIPTGDGNFLLSGRSSTQQLFPPFATTEAIVTGGGGLIDEMIEISLDEKRIDGSDLIIKQVHMIIDPETNEGIYEGVFTTYPASGNSSAITQPGTVDLFKCSTLKQ